jgi:hypothetical protein
VFNLKEIDSLPPKVLKEVADFISYVKYKYNINDKSIKIDEITLASEKSLAKDWLKPEEDEAWKRNCIACPARFGGKQLQRELVNLKKTLVASGLERGY